MRMQELCDNMAYYCVLQIRRHVLVVDSNQQWNWFKSNDLHYCWIALCHWLVNVKCFEVRSDEGEQCVGEAGVLFKLINLKVTFSACLLWLVRICSFSIKPHIKLVVQSWRWSNGMSTFTVCRGSTEKGQVIRWASCAAGDDKQGLIHLEALHTAF